MHWDGVDSMKCFGKLNPIYDKVKHTKQLLSDFRDWGNNCGEEIATLGLKDEQRVLRLSKW